LDLLEEDAEPALVAEVAAEGRDKLRLMRDLKLLDVVGLTSGTRYLRA
jgi:hypothetical protein